MDFSAVPGFHRSEAEPGGWATPHYSKGLGRERELIQQDNLRYGE